MPSSVLAYGKMYPKRPVVTNAKEYKCSFGQSFFIASSALQDALYISFSKETKSRIIVWVNHSVIRAGQRFALPALGRGRRNRPTRKMLRRRKLPEIAADSPASGARFVGRFLQKARCEKRGLCLNNEIMAYYSIFDNHQKQRIKANKTGHVHALLRCSLNNVQPCVIRQKVRN